MSSPGSSPPVIGIVGWKNSGKTTLTVRLVEEFTKRGLRVSTFKHAHHAFQIDNGDTDSARHRRAGAAQVAIVSSERWALVTELRGAPEPSLDDVLATLAPCDIVIVEGYKAAAIPKIEARRLEQRDKQPLAGTSPNVIAIAADHRVDTSLPSFDLGDISAIADFVTSRLDLPSQR